MRAAIQRVVARATQQGVDTAAAEDRVVVALAINELGIRCALDVVALLGCGEAGDTPPECNVDLVQMVVPILECPTAPVDRGKNTSHNSEVEDIDIAAAAIDVQVGGDLRNVVEFLDREIRSLGATYIRMELDLFDRGDRETGTVEVEGANPAQEDFVGARTAINGFVLVVAGEKLEHVVASAADKTVSAAAADQCVIAAVADQRIVSGVADQIVIGRIADNAVRTRATCGVFDQGPRIAIVLECVEDVAASEVTRAQICLLGGAEQGMAARVQVDLQVGGIGAEIIGVDAATIPDRCKDAVATGVDADCAVDQRVTRSGVPFVDGIGVVGRKICAIEILQRGDVGHHEGLRITPGFIGIACGRAANVGPVGHDREFHRVISCRQGDAQLIGRMPVAQPEGVANLVNDRMPVIVARRRRRAGSAEPDIAVVIDLGGDVVAGEVGDPRCADQSGRSVGQANFVGVRSAVVEYAKAGESFYRETGRRRAAIGRVKRKMRRGLLLRGQRRHVGDERRVGRVAVGRAGCREGIVDAGTGPSGVGQNAVDDRVARSHDCCRGVAGAALDLRRTAI